MPQQKIYSSKILRIFLSLIIVPLIILPVFADSTPPQTNISKNPPTPNGNENWYLNPVEITLNATDLESGIKKIFYKINNQNWQETEFYQTLNLAPNPSFEYQLNSWEISPNDGYVVASPDYTIYKFGQNSMKLTSSGIGWHSINHASTFSVVEPYSTVTLSTWIKTENIPQNVYFKIYTASTDSQGNIIKQLVSQSETITGNNEWKKISKTVTLNNKDSLGVFIEIGLEGTGTIWIDGVNINKSGTDEQTKFYLNQDGENTLSYYSIDQEGNIETTKTISLKIDQTPPSNWGQLKLTKGPQNPDFVVSVQTEISDATSGLSKNTKNFQYKIDTNYGTYSTLDSCSSNWQDNNWANLANYPSSDGTPSATLITPEISFCDSAWSKCKSLRFKAYDVAGNISTKEFCINGPWIKITGQGKIKANKGISMTSQSLTTTSDGIVESGNSVIEFFSTSKGFIAKNTSKLERDSYEDLWNLSKNKTEITELSTNSGSYFIKNNFELDSLPTGFSSANFTQLIFIEGDLIISKDIKIAKSSALLFVVKGDVKIEKNVKAIEAGIIADKNIYTAYNAQSNENTQDITFKGVFTANIFVLQRRLSINSLPTEIFIYEPKYMVKMKDYLGRSTVEWIQIN